MDCVREQSYSLLYFIDGLLGGLVSIISSVLMNTNEEHDFNSVFFSPIINHRFIRQKRMYVSDLVSSDNRPFYSSKRVTDDITIFARYLGHQYFSLQIRCVRRLA